MAHRLTDSKHGRWAKTGDASRGASPARSFEGSSSGYAPRLYDHLRMLGHEDMAVREAAASTLLGIGPDAVPPLLDLLATGDWGVRELAAVDVLKRFGDPRAIPVLEELLENGGEGQRIQSAKALRWHHAGPEPFERALGDTSWQVRIEALFALSDIGRKSFFPLFAAALKDEHYRVRAAAANALGRLRDSRAAKHLARAVRDEHNRVRAMAVWGMRHIGSAQNAAALIETLGSDDCELRLTAIRALGRLRAKQAVQPLAALIKDACPGQREEIAVALGMIGDASAVAPLAALVENGLADLKHKAAWSLAAIGRPSVEALKVLSRHKDHSVRYFAVFALGHIGLAHVAETVFARLRDESALVRDEAAGALEKLKPRAR